MSVALEKQVEVSSLYNCYLHRMPGELVHDDGVFWLVKRSGHMLYKETEDFLIFLCRHHSASSIQVLKRIYIKLQIVVGKTKKGFGAIKTPTKNWRE